VWNASYSLTQGEHLAHRAKNQWDESGVTLVSWVSP